MKILSKLCLALLAAMLLISIGSAGIISVLIKLNLGLSVQSIKIVVASLASIGYLILFPVFISGTKKKPITTIYPTLKFTFFNGIKYYLVLLGGTSVLSFLGYKITEGIMELSGHANVNKTMAGQMMEGVPISLIFICVVVVSPIAEELLFRKVLLERLLPYGEFSAIGISSVLFGLYHFNFEQLFYTALLGVVCVNIVMKTGKVRYAIYEHMLFNLFGGIISGFIPNNFYINLIIKTIFFIGAIIICIFWGKELFILETNPKTRSKKLDMKSEVRCGGFILFILFFLVNAIGTLIEI